MGGGGNSDLNNNNNSSCEDIQVRLVPLRSCAITGVVNSMPVMIEIDTRNAKPQQETKRQAFDLCIVLDRSGSMRGEKLENSKKAIIQVIENLSSDDILHFIVYGSDITTIFENQTCVNRDTLIEEVQAIGTSGCTNLSGGVEAGSKVLHQSKLAHANDHKSRTQRIFLFSDGLANEGITDKQGIWNLISKIRDGGVYVSAFGIGNDFDETLMKGIAEYGSGDYEFIDTAENIPSFVDSALKGLLGLLGTSTTLKIRGHNGAVVKKLYGFSSDDLLAGAKIGDLRAENLRQLVVDIEIISSQVPSNNENNNNNDTRKILTLELAFDDPKTGTDDGKNRARKTIHSSLSVEFTEHDSRLNECNTKVLVAKAIQEHGEEDKEVLGLIDKGKIKEATAAKEKQLEKLKKVLELEPDNEFLQLLIKAAEKSIKDLKAKGDVRQFRKEVHYMSHNCARNEAYGWGHYM